MFLTTVKILKRQSLIDSLILLSNTPAIGSFFLLNIMKIRPEIASDEVIISKVNHKMKHYRSRIAAIVIAILTSLL